ncbi:hypothetical protein TWF192_010751 [Orbilia oligospora]|uniref:Uncharacterized protein n=1 Tax=Orbilia oligospora TaxID=2813651 RepID=A0A6G1LXT1_ORBOL|nr:hypothetical protein TWF679_005103 [Orbilia oligospora]KAF3197981.1 hypothetical protein TWF191_005170 [Orbilia oligospora]KAF3237745.1 hypothetical protein TWF192_010751 [Orbilia oligospora]
MEPTTAELMQHISDLHEYMKAMSDYQDLVNKRTNARMAVLESNEEIFFKVCKLIVLASFGDYILTLHGWNGENKDQFVSANCDKLAATYNITRAHTIAFFRERNIAAHQCTARTVASFLIKSSNKAGRATGFPFKLPAEQPVPPSPLLPLLPSFPSASESTQTSRASEKKRIAEHEEDEEIIGGEKQKGTKFSFQASNKKIKKVKRLSL